MKVNIAYSVELDEILSNTFEVLTKERETTVKTLNESLQQLSIPIDDDNLMSTLETLTKCRETLAKLDTKLGEIYNVLLGYGQIRYKQMQPSPVPREPETEGNDE
jgi:hypothetical protein